MKITEIQTFEGQWKLVLPNLSVEVFGNKGELDEFAKKRDIKVEISLTRKDVPHEAIISLTPPSEWSQDYGTKYNWWRRRYPAVWRQTLSGKWKEDK